MIEPDTKKSNESSPASTDEPAEVFAISKKQWAKVLLWCSKHKWVPMGTIGGSYTFSFTPTSLGVVMKVKNNANGEEIDISEYEDW